MRNPSPTIEPAAEAAESTWLASRIGRPEGLPTSQVHRSAPGPHGTVVMATPAGLAIDDGVSTQVFTTKDGLTCNGLRWVGAGPADRVWIGSDVGFDLLDVDGSIHSPRSEQQPGLVTSGIADSDGCWLASASGLYRVKFQDGRFETNRWATEGDHDVLLMGVDGRGNALCVDAEDVLHRWDGAAWVGLPTNGYRSCGAIRAIEADDANNILVGGANGFCRIDSTGQLLTFVPTTEVSGSVTALLRREDHVFVAVGSSLRRYGVDPIRGLVFEDALAQSCSITNLWADECRNVWASTTSHGLVKLSGLDKLVKFAEIPSVGAVFSIRQRRSGALVIGGENGILIPTGSGDHVTHTKLLQGVRVWDVLETRIGETVVATDEGVIVVDSLDAAHSLVPGNTDLAERSRALLKRSDGIWIGTIKGLLHYDGTRVLRILDAERESLGYVYHLWEDRYGVLWAATLGRGLWHETPDGMRQFSGAPLRDPSNTYAIDEHPDGRLAIAADAEVFVGRRDAAPDEWLSIPLSCAATTVLFGPGNTLYVGTADGLLVIDSSNGEIVRSIHPVLGVEGWEFTTSRALALASDGTVLCGVTSGLICVDFDGIAALTDRPKPYLASVRWDEADGSTRVEPPASSTEVVAGNWTMEICVRSDWRIDEAQTTFSCRIEGFNEHWAGPVATGQFWYTSLPVGEYTIRCQMHSPVVGDGPVTDLMQLRVVPPE